MGAAPTPFRRVLVANRGEVARRVFRAARSLGLETVAVFADDDRWSVHAREADRAVPLGAGPPAATYLDVEAVVGAATRARADAIHPGYGFLSEDPRLAEACVAAGMVWVGPPAAAMAAMAHKATAKATVAAAGVPVLEGRIVDDRTAADPRALAALAAEVGYPLLVKASAGGGGRGMRAVVDPGALVAAVAAARREAAASFGSDEVFLERLVPSPRHVEVQVVADRDGRVVHLFDRECSVQRRHQKVVEEAPATLVADHVRERMWSAAVAAARAVAYEGAGTVEFVVDGDDVAFLEMNTRLQVEHGVTELVTGIDLVALQFLVAGGLPLPFTQTDVVTRGHAVEARLCAERPSEDYRPTPGTVRHARWPDGDGVRVDAAVETGSVVPAAYDSLVAKVMAHGDRRGTAIARLRAGLCGPLELDGLETNRELLAALLSEEDFLSGRTATDYLDRHPSVVAAAPADSTRRRHAAAAALSLEHDRAMGSIVPGAPPSWRNLGRAEHRDRFSDGDRELSVVVSRSAGRLEVVVEGPGDLAAPLGGAVAAQVYDGDVALEVDGVVYHHRIRHHGELVCVSSAEGQSTFRLDDPEHAAAVAGAAGECRAPLPGAVVRVLVAVGDQVDDGDGLVVLEAMKMEHTLRAAAAGTVREVRTAAGRQVDVGDVLVVTDPIG